jgi:uncharacterized Rmd1/YagE family protein
MSASPRINPMNAPNGERVPLLNGVTSQRPGALLSQKTIQQRPVSLDANRNMFQKQTRPRKAVAEFRKKTRQDTRHWVGRVGVHLHVDELDIDKVADYFEKKGWNVKTHFEVVRIWKTETPYIGHELWSDWPLSEDEEGHGDSLAIDMTAAMPEIYLFRFGACVFWNFPNEEYEKQWINENLLGDDVEDDFSGDLYKDDEIESALDSVSFQFGKVDAKFAIKRDVCLLSSKEPEEKLAVSFALAKSSLLSLYELRVQEVIERNSHLPEEMVKHGRVHMSSDDLTREIGRLFLVKHGINLDQSLIDTPEEFWEDDRFENTYEMTMKYFKISNRLDLVNNRLDMVGELHNKILEENHTHHAVILEWIIIWLIVIEVLLDLLHLGVF